MFENLISVSGNSNEFMTFHFAALPAWGSHHLDHAFFWPNLAFRQILLGIQKRTSKWFDVTQFLKKILNFSSFLCSYLKVQGGRRFSTSKAINKRPFFVRIEYKMAKILFLSIPFQCTPTTFQASSSKMGFGR